MHPPSPRNPRAVPLVGRRRWHATLALTVAAALHPGGGGAAAFSLRPPLEQTRRRTLSPRAAADDPALLVVAAGSATELPTAPDPPRRRFAIHTPAGSFNLFGLYFGCLSVGLGAVWGVALTACSLLYRLTGGRVDRARRIPVFCSHMWGTLLMLLTGSMPVVENREILTDFYKANGTAMFIANHNSWMDIPFLCSTIGWRNYKIVAKKELLKVPILGSAVAIAGNVVVDRRDRRSQIQTLRSGIKWLNDGVHLCTFPEGTRSKTGRLNPFKRGAFKMAQSADVPIIPLSIVGSAEVMPLGWMFPVVRSRAVPGRVVVHQPVSTTNKTESEIVVEVRESIISGLPEHQRPIP